MVKRLLIVRGVRTTDQLQALGLPMARRYDSADLVALVGDDGRGMLVKGAESGVTTVVEHYDADPSAGRCMRAVLRVKDAFETCGHLRQPAESIAEVVGMFIYFWPVDPHSSAQIVAEAIEAGDSAAVESAAERFIACNFGSDLSPLAMIPGHASHGDAAGRDRSGTQASD